MKLQSGSRVFYAFWPRYGSDLLYSSQGLHVAKQSSQTWHTDCLTDNIKDMTHMLWTENAQSTKN